MTTVLSPVSRATGELAAYLAAAADRPLPPEVAEQGRLHLLDTLASIVSGSVAPAGHRARAWYTAAFGDAAGPSTLVGTARRIPPFAAAVCNGMAAHAAETDDSHAPTLSHPGCSVLPAALAVAEQARCSGAVLLHAFVAGYDVGCRVGRAAHSADRGRLVGRWSSHAVVGTFASAAASAVCAGLDEQSCRYLFSYAAQVSAGVTTWVRDPHHVEKAFVFGGMPAGHGVLAASLVAAGCDGVDDVFAGSPNWLEAVTAQPDPDALAAGLGRRFEVMETTIKQFAVGSPCQSPLAALLALIEQHGLVASDVSGIEVVLEPRGAAVVNGRAMPNVNLQYLLAATLIDGRFSRTMAHDAQRMLAPDVLALRSRVQLIADPGLTGMKTATVRVTTTSGRVVERTVSAVRGAPTNPMTAAEVTAKAVDLLSEVYDAGRAEQIAAAVLHIDRLASVDELTRLLRDADFGAGKGAG